METKKETKPRKPRTKKISIDPNDTTSILQFFNHLIIYRDENDKMISFETTLDTRSINSIKIEVRYFNGEVSITEYDKTIYNEAMFMNELKKLERNDLKEITKTVNK